MTKKRTAYISTFSKEHLPIYGDKFFAGFKNVVDPLYFYAENFSKENTFDFFETIPQHKEFYNHIKHVQSNLTHHKDLRRLDKALRWSYKSYVIIHALENIDTDYLIWIDGDVQVLKTPPENLCQNLCGNSLMFGFDQYINRAKHIESGFIIFNKRHANIDLLLNGYKEGYYDRKILNLPKPWDGFWLAELSNRPNIKEYCKLIKGPFRCIKEWFYHDVGKNKFQNTNLNRHLGR